MSRAKQLLIDESGLETVAWAIVGGVVVARASAMFVAIEPDVKRGMGALDLETSSIQ